MSDKMASHSQERRQRHMHTYIYLSVYPLEFGKTIAGVGASKGEECYENRRYAVGKRTVNLKSIHVISSNPNLPCNSRV